LDIACQVANANDVQNFGGCDERSKIRLQVTTRYVKVLCRNQYFEQHVLLFIEVSSIFGFGKMFSDLWRYS
jgi:hypothetical protein